MQASLLSLQQISKQQDQTQLRLSTGLKVNSAIDNPSSYYTAQSLTNRVDDLSALLDAMGQGIQTIKAANEGIEKAQDLIEQMKSIAEQIMGNSKVPDKDYFIEKVGLNGAVVSTAKELQDAINSGKETICVYGKIDLGDISTAGGITLNSNQKLVGVEYFGHFSNGKDFSMISGTSHTANKSLITINKTGCLISDLSFNYNNQYVTPGENGNVIYVNGSNITAEVRDVNITMKTNETNEYGKAAIYTSKAGLNISGKINILASGGGCRGIISVSAGSYTNILSDAVVNIDISGLNSKGIYAQYSTTVDIRSGAYVNITQSGANACGMHSLAGIANININSGATVSILTSGLGLSVEANMTIAGNIKIVANTGGITSWGTTDILSTACIYMNNTNTLINSNANGQMNIFDGAKIAYQKDRKDNWYEAKGDNSFGGSDKITTDNINTKLNLAETEAWQTAEEIIADKNRQDEENNDYSIVTSSNISNYQQSFNNALSQYDSLIKDSAYKGINLLKGDELKINFNEDRSSNLLVEGEDITSEKIGITEVEWQTAKSVQNSLTQVLEAQTKLRETAGKLGNYYSIITERSNFTDKLIQVLEEGADKLTLADMNEESANMLALQTRQNLATNALSLASQANQAILKLF